MSVTRPAELVGWDINNVNVTRPSDATKDNGYANNAVPPAAEHNWIFQQLSAWIAYLGGGLKVRTISPIIGGNSLSDPWTYTGDAITSNASSPSICNVPMSTTEGETIDSVILGCDGNGVTDCTITLFKQNAAGALVTLATLADINRPATGTYTDVVLNSATPGSLLPYTVVAGDTLSINLNANGANYNVGRVGISAKP